jgi:hypothetical protein
MPRNAQNGSGIRSDVFPGKNPGFGLDERLFPATVVVPREADSLNLECVLRTFWDCKLAQFCPAQPSSVSQGGS